LTGLSPLLDPKNPYIRGDTGGGRGYPHHIGGYMGGLTIILGVPSHTQLLYYIPMVLPTNTNTKIQMTNTMNAFNGFFIRVNVLIVLQIYGNIFIWPKKKRDYCPPSSSVINSVCSSGESKPCSTNVESWGWQHVPLHLHS
jgi:hypothetical protein